MFWRNLHPLLQVRRMITLVMYTTFGNHLASFIKLECADNETLVDVTRKCCVTCLMIVCWVGIT